MFRITSKALALATFAIVSATTASAGTDANDQEGWSIFGPVNGSGWSIFGPVSGSGWGVDPTQPGAGGDGWSIFGPVSGSGWSIFGPVHGSGWGVNPAQPGPGNGWSIFGPVNGSGWSIFGSVPNGFGVNSGPSGIPNINGIPVVIALPPSAAGLGTPAQQPRFVAIHCTFGQDVMLMAKSVEDCETAGGTVDPALKDAAASSGGN